jgi:hypothetical protein
MMLTQSLEDLRIYHRGPLVIDRERKYDPDLRSDKPDGMWFSVQADWWRFCINDSWTSGVADRIVHRLDIRPIEDLLLLQTPDDLLAFTEKWKTPPNEFRRRGYAIDWRAVAEQWPGIIIQPYVWEMRLDDRCGWYYSWDAASGCIWNMDYVRRAVPFMRIDEQGCLACL